MNTFTLTNEDEVILIDALSEAVVSYKRQKETWENLGEEYKDFSRELETKQKNVQELLYKVIRATM